MLNLSRFYMGKFCYNDCICKTYFTGSQVILQYFRLEQSEAQVDYCRVLCSKNLRI